MEQLSEIQLLELGTYTVNLLQLTSLVAVALASVLLYWLLEHRLLDWYYGLETTSVRNQARMRRVVRFTIFGIFTVLILRIFEIDYPLLNQPINEDLLSAAEKEAMKLKEMANPDGANDSNGPRYIIKISHLVEVLIAYIIANLLDMVLGEILTQRYFRRRNEGEGKSADATEPGDSGKIPWLRPLLITLVVILFANETHIARFDLFTIPTGGSKSGFVLTVAGVLHAMLVLCVVSLSLSFLISFILKGYYQRSKIDTGSQFAINRLITYFAYFIGILLVIQAAGFNLIGIWTGAAALLVGIGIGLQQTFNDLICGIIILFERSVKVGDVVELSGHQVGTVRKVGARTSVVETRDDIIIFVPNSKLIGENVTNWSQVERKARFHVAVGVAYGSDTQLVKEILIKAAKDHNRVQDSPPPFVRFLDFGDSSLNFEVLFWSRDMIRVEDTKSDIRFAIDAAFRARGVEIPFPQRDLWIRGGLAPDLSGKAPPSIKAGKPEEEGAGTQDAKPVDKAE
jgi:small-conductance mechanosensitive channel